MNKKPIIIAVAIAVIVISIISVVLPTVNESTQIPNKTIQNSTTGKHYDVNLDEHVGVKTT